MNKISENLNEAKKIILAADHLVYVSFSLIKDKKILLRTIEETKKAVSKIINAVLQYEYLYKRIKLSPDPKINFQIFQNKVAKRYNITNNDLKLILELFKTIEEHKKSTMEFLRGEKIVILAEKDQKPTIVDLEKAKEYVNLGKTLLYHINEKMNK